MASEKQGCIQVFTTVSMARDASSIADALVTGKLAACVQIVGPIVSVYRWKGKKEHAKEWLLIIKSRRNLYGKIERLIGEIHPYDLPELTLVPMSGSNRYLKWVNKETAQVK